MSDHRRQQPFDLNPVSFSGLRQLFIAMLNCLYYSNHVAWVHPATVRYSSSTITSLQLANLFLRLLSSSYYLNTLLGLPLPLNE